MRFTLDEPTPVFLDVRDLSAGYGTRQVLNKIDLIVRVGAIVALIGHNGSGKSTLLKALYGIVPISSGSLSVAGHAISTISPRSMMRKEIAYLPQGNCVFPNLTVADNLELSVIEVDSAPSRALAIDESLKYFPTLKDKLKRRAGSLSGGEKQVLALAGILARSPKLLLLDEPSLGLSPQLSVQTFRRLRELNKTLGISMLIVEQKVRGVLSIADYAYVFRNGEVSFSGRPDRLLEGDFLTRAYL
jgi:ABC-type branched-subunit amino acid transport system ATPase component